MRPIFTDGLPFRTFLISIFPARHHRNESDLPATQGIQAGDLQGILKARLEQKECQDVSGAMQKEKEMRNLD